MAINFPSNPSTNDTHTVNNRVWQYDGEKWGVVGANLEPVVASLTVGGDFTVDSATLKVDSVNNRVGIGTTSPAAALDVAATGANAVHTHGQVRIDGADTSRLTFGSTDGSTNLWNIDNSNGLFRVFREDWAATGTGANGSTKLVITDTGNVGIGTDTPTYVLETNSSSYQMARFESSGGEVNISLKSTSTGGRDYQIVSGGSGGGFAGGKFGIYDATGNALRFTIDSSGNVGIGTDSPGGMLAINKALGTGANDTEILQQFRSTVGAGGNISFLTISNIRESAGGTDWTTAHHRIQHKVDATDMAYIDFNPESAEQGLALGTGNTEKVTIDYSGNVKLNSSGSDFQVTVDGTNFYGLGKYYSNNGSANISATTNWTKVAEVTVPKGRWLVIATGRFEYSITTQRQFWWRIINTSTGTIYNNEIRYQTNETSLMIPMAISDVVVTGGSEVIQLQAYQSVAEGSVGSHGRLQVIGVH